MKALMILALLGTASAGDAQPGQPRPPAQEEHQRANQPDRDRHGDDVNCFGAQRGDDSARWHHTGENARNRQGDNNDYNDEQRDALCADD
jgi:hypothetical protein